MCFSCAVLRFYVCRLYIPLGECFESWMGLILIHSVIYLTQNLLLSSRNVYLELTKIFDNWYIGPTGPWCWPPHSSDGNRKTEHLLWFNYFNFIRIIRFARIIWLWFSIKTLVILYFFYFLVFLTFIITYYYLILLLLQIFPYIK